MKSAVPDSESLGYFLHDYGFVGTLTVGPFRQVFSGGVTCEVSVSGKACLITFLESADAGGVIRLLDCLRDAGIPCPRLMARMNGNVMGVVDGCPGFVSEYPPGHPVKCFTPAQSASVGTLLANLHLVDCKNQEDAPSLQRMPRSWRDIGQMSALSVEDSTLLRDEIRFQGLYRLDDLPQGPVHGAIGRETLLFGGENVTGLLGLEGVRTGPWLSDLAMAVTACCSEGDVLNGERILALLKTYHALRPLKPVERGAWPVMLRYVALQRWIEALRRDGVSASSAGVEKARLLKCISQESLFQRMWP